MKFSNADVKAVCGASGFGLLFVADIVTPNEIAEMTKGTPMSLPNADPDEQLKPIAFDFADRDLILNLWTVESDIEGRFKLAPVKGNRVVVQLNAYDLDELLGSIAAIANHESNAKRRRQLDDLFKRVSDTLETEFPQ